MAIRMMATIFMRRKGKRCSMCLGMFMSYCHLTGFRKVIQGRKFRKMLWSNDQHPMTEHSKHQILLLPWEFHRWGAAARQHPTNRSLLEPLTKIIWLPGHHHFLDIGRWSFP